MLITKHLADWNPLREMERMEQQINRIFGEIESSAFRAYPPMNAWSTDEQTTVEFELPGYKAEDIETSIDGRTLTVRGRRPQEAADGKITYHRRERRSGEFERQLYLPYRVETEEVKANFRDGVLTITLPRAEADKPKKIPVMSGVN